MAINFPDSPNNGDSFTSNNKTWVFDGTVWNITSGTNSVADGAITTAKIDTGAVTAVKIASGAAVSNIGYTPANVASPTFTGTVVLPSTTSIGTVSSTELGYVDGVTSAIQTQLDSKLTATTDVTSNRNLLINGAMQVDQRNGGALYTMVNATYGLDRWTGLSSAASKYSVQRLTTTPPAGFGYYQRFTSLAATADTASAYYNFYQVIEGFNATKLAWGTASAKSVLLSFWVRSSLTGTFGGALRNAGSGGFYSYAFTYTINSANTWEYKTISITGSTAGTWGSTNDAGVNLFFDLGCNSAETQAAGSWQNANKLGANGCVRLIGTNAATLDITGVQLEAGSVATPFEFEDIGTTERKCQRYYEWGVASGSGYAQITAIFDAGSTSNIDFKVSKRAVPTMTNMSLSGNQYPNNQGNSVPRYENGHTRAFRYTTEHNTAFWNVTTGNGGSTGVAGHQIIWNASAEL